MITLVTGASYGIGEELAKTFAENGSDLILVARTQERLHLLAREISSKYAVRCEAISVDLTDGAALGSFCEKLKDRSIDVLVNNAGFGDWGPFHERDWKKNSDMIDLNVKATTRLTHFFLPKMIERKSGKILNVASTAGFQSMPHFNVYAATKAYIIHFSEALAEEVKEFGVQVCALCPGPTNTRFKEVADMKESRVFKNWNLPSPFEVARFGYESLMRGETVAIHGTFNRALMEANRIVPRSWAAKIAKKLQGHPG